jgi:23S rRNA pseudouridine2605 synthase
MPRQKKKSKAQRNSEQDKKHPFAIFFKQKNKTVPPQSTLKKHFAGYKKIRTTGAGIKSASLNTNVSKKKSESARPNEPIRLNKFLSNAGIAARRKADELIKQGLVTVNDQVVTEMGYKVTSKDVVKYNGKVVKPGKKVYILFNKPKDCITSTRDERGRKTVMDYVSRFTKEYVFPVGRLDRNTTGLLLLTNDGDLAQKLSHPRYEVKKVYAVELDKKLQEVDLEKIRKGVMLEEGIARVDDIQYADESNKKIIGIELHIGWNRVVRRIFESLGYEVKKLDRVMYAGLTKKDLPRGRCRYLTQREIIMLKHFT